MLATLTLAFPLALCVPQDPIPSVLLRAGEPLPGAAPGDVLTWAGSPRSTPNGEFGCAVQVQGSFNRGIYSDIGGTPEVLVTQQNGVEILWPELQLVGGEPVYVGDFGGPCAELAVWQGSTAVLCNGSPSPVAGLNFDFFPSTRILGNAPNGEYFVHTSVDLLTIPHPRVLLRGPSMTPVMLPGVSLPGLNLPVKSVSLVRSSPRASHWAAVVRLDNPNQDDPVLVVDGTPPLVEGVPVRRGNLVDPSSGSTERWFRLYDCAVSETGSWMVRGRTNGAGPIQEVVMRDGEIILRQGDVLDGFTLDSSVRFLGFGADGSEMILWNSGPASSAPEPVLFIDRSATLWNGTPLDLDGDGEADPGWSVLGVQSTITPFPTEEPADIDEDGVLRAACTIADPTTTYNALLEIRLPIGEPTCAALPNSTGLGATLVGAGTSRVASNAFELRAAQLPPGQFGYFLTGAMEALPIPGGVTGNLCLGGGVGRVLASTGLTSADGELAYTLDLGALPRPNGNVAVQPGETWHFQCWFRDVGGVSEFSSGLRVLFR